MATAAPLPAIGRSSSTPGQSPSAKHVVTVIPTPPKSPPSQKPSYLKQMRRSQGKKEREQMLKMEMLRAQQPDLTKKETAAYRKTYLHNLSLDMLQEGYHQSYSELFALIKEQHAARQLAGPDSLLWNKTLLEDEHEKLDTMKLRLSQAEAADRAEDYLEVYNSLYQLARYFQSTEDKWLADHFFQKCLLTSGMIDSGEGRKLAEGHCNMGLAVEESNEYFQAAEHFEHYHGLTSEHKDWANEDGESLHSGACSHLTRIYTTIARKLESSDLEQSLEYLIKAYTMAKEGSNKKEEAAASYLLGLSYEKNKDAQTALLYLNKYFDMCKAMNDNDGLGMACEAIAKAYERQEKVEDSIKYLQMFVDVAEKSGKEQAVSRACSDLGTVFNSLSRYEEAAEYFTKAYNISRSLNDKESISSSRVQYGIAIAHKMFTNVSRHIDVATKPCLDRLVEWKNSRGDSFEKPIPEGEIEPSLGVQSSRTSTVTSAAPSAAPSVKDEQEEAPEHPEVAEMQKVQVDPTKDMTFDSQPAEDADE